MKIITNTLFSRISAYGQILASGALIFSFLPPFLSSPASLAFAPAKEGALKALSAPVKSPISLVNAFFGEGVSASVSQPIIDKQIALVSTRDAFPASLSVIRKNEAMIRAAADKYGVPTDVAIGVSLLENGGSETAVSSAGALGVFQLMPGTARSLGLTVNKKVDERKDVEKNIDAGVSYLKMNYDRFGDWGLATWAYHAGEGNVMKALALYKKSGGTGTPTIHKLLSSAAVKPMTKKLSDDSAGYPYKVIATATLFRQAASGSAAIPGSVADNN
ncbi:transglycosylase SLT domain-containing protein [Candidatus Parcubacteria bacterium]|nr:transglycosylase SLT domain-containing protein [Candidatus Parcubacteria bacterium]